MAGGAPARRGEGRRDLLLTAALLLIAILGIALVQRPLEAANRHVQETTDVYALPPPPEVVLLSLGYRSALADQLWAQVLVSQGLHTQEKRRFGNLIRLLDAINELEPSFQQPYLMVDALITFQASGTPREEVLKAREIMERGAANRPLDAELLLGLGEFVAFIAPASYITEPAEQAAWRVDGARYLARAAELAGNDANISWRALGGVGLLSRAGERDAAIHFLQRTLAVTDDPELKATIQAQLDHLSGERQSAQRDDLFRRLDEGVWAQRHRDLPFVARMEYMVLGPPRDPAYCAGPAHALEARCAPSWQAWEERSEAERAAGK